MRPFEMKSPMNCRDRSIDSASLLLIGWKSAPKEMPPTWGGSSAVLPIHGFAWVSAVPLLAGVTVTVAAWQRFCPFWLMISCFVSFLAILQLSYAPELATGSV